MRKCLHEQCSIRHMMGPVYDTAPDGERRSSCARGKLLPAAMHSKLELWQYPVGKCSHEKPGTWTTSLVPLRLTRPM